MNIRRIFFLAAISSLISAPAISETQVSSGDKSPIINKTGGNVIINYSEQSPSVKRNSRQRSIFDLVTVGSTKEYIESLLGKGKIDSDTYAYFQDNFVLEVSYDSQNIAESLKVIPTDPQFANDLDISQIRNGQWEGPHLNFGSATIGDFFNDHDSKEISANMAGAGNMNCINFASYTYKNKPHAMDASREITVGYQAAPCVDNGSGVQYYMMYDGQDSMLWKAVANNNEPILSKLRINFISITKTNEY